LDPDVVVLTANDLVGNDLHLLGDFAELAPHEALDREHRVLGVGDLLTLGRHADQPLAALRESDDRRRRAPALPVRDDGRLTALEHRHARVGGAQVDSDCLAHSQYLRWGKKKNAWAD